MLIKYLGDLNNRVYSFNLIENRIYNVYALLIDFDDKDIKYILYDGNHIRFVRNENIKILDSKFLRGYYKCDIFNNLVIISEYRGFDYDHYYNLLDGYSEFDEKIAQSIFIKEKKELDIEFRKRRVELAILAKLITGEIIDNENDVISYYYNNKIEIFYQIKKGKIVLLEILSDERDLNTVNGLIF
jgi:hypothetical protein